MADFHIDEDVPVALAQEPIALGHTALTARDLYLTGALDAVHMQQAAFNKRILVTHNKRDFRTLHQAWTTWFTSRPHAGILVMKQHIIFAPQMAHDINAFLTAGRDMANRIYEWKRGGRWEQL